jgi:hypothetical protein
VVFYIATSFQQQFDCRTFPGTYMELSNLVKKNYRLYYLWVVPGIFLEIKGYPAGKADNLTVIYEQIF